MHDTGCPFCKTGVLQKDWITDGFCTQELGFGKQKMIPDVFPLAHGTVLTGNWMFKTVPCGTLEVLACYIAFATFRTRFYRIWILCDDDTVRKKKKVD